MMFFRTLGIHQREWFSSYGVMEKFWIVFWSFLSATMLALSFWYEAFREVNWTNLGLLVLTLVGPPLTYRLGWKVFSFGRIVMAALYCWHTYEYSGLFIKVFRKTSYEIEMIQADLWLFGANPSVWLQSYHHPILSEYLQAAYLSYFPLLLATGIALLMVREHREYFKYVASLAIAYLVCQVFYVLVPVRSPFLLEGVEPYASWISYDFPLAGLWFFESMRASILEATTMRHDCFPSGHTMHSLIAAYFAWRVNRVTGALVSILAASIVLATLYLRYHYAIDLIVGASFAAIIVFACTRMTQHYFASDPIHALLQEEAEQGWYWEWKTALQRKWDSFVR